MDNILSIDVGGTFIKWSIINDYKRIDSGKVETPYGSVDCFFEAVGGIIEENRHQNIQGVAISYPGIISDDDVILQGGSLQYMNGVNICEEFQKRFNLKAAVEKDSRCSCLCEAEIGNLKGVKNGMTIVIGTGIGGAILTDGKLLKGAFNSEGEISFLFTQNLFRADMRGIIANKIGMGGFTRKIRQEFNDEQMEAITFMKMVEDGNKHAVDVFNEYIEEFVTFIFNLRCILDFEKVAIGGGISENDFFIQTLKAKYDAAFANFPIPMKHGEIVACKYQNGSNLLGAYINYQKKYHLI